MEKIESTKNAKVKLLMELQQKSAERRRRGLFVVEGRRELEHCMEAGYEVDTVFACPALYGHGNLPRASRIVEVTEQVYAHIAYRGTTEGIIAEVRAHETTLDSLFSPLAPSDSPLFVVLESVEKPGNLGAVLRSADAAGATAVIVCDPLTDLYNPNLIRSSIGALFTVPTVACSSEECIRLLKQHGVQILTAQLQDSLPYYDTPMTGATAIVMGTESTGLSPLWRQAADRHIRIPMLGRLDSLNVSVSAAILMFEAVRQREMHGKVRKG
ncbi:MAG: RNA methyltransferase [Bacteroidaceae bacterium]|nr:RNA methyltransferase [Bacteroidaceae bacterium]